MTSFAPALDQAWLTPDDEKICLSYHAGKLQAALRSASKRYKQLTGRTWRERSPVKQRMASPSANGPLSQSAPPTCESAHMGQRDSRTCPQVERREKAGGQCGPHCACKGDRKAAKEREEGLEKRREVIRARAAQAIAEEQALKAGRRAKREEQLAAKLRAQEALDEVRREVETEKERYAFERWVMAAEPDEGINPDQKGEGSICKTAPAVGDVRTLSPDGSVHPTCVCACLKAVLGPQTSSSPESPQGINEGRGEEETDVYADDNNTWSEGEGDMCSSSEEDDSEAEMGTDVRQIPRSGRWNEQAVSVGRKARADERTRLERLCLELARLEKRLEEVVGRKKGVFSEQESHPVQGFEDKKVILEGPTRSEGIYTGRRTANQAGVKAGGFFRGAGYDGQVKPRVSREFDGPSKPPPGARDAGRASSLARGAYDAAQSCQQGVRACPYRRTVSSRGDLEEWDGRNPEAFWPKCGRDEWKAGRDARRPDTARARSSRLDGGKPGSDQIARLRRQNRALSTHCRRQVSALQDVVKKARVAEGLATRAARAAAAASHPDVRARCGPGAVCRHADRCGLREDIKAGGHGAVFQREWMPLDRRPCCASCA